MSAQCTLVYICNAKKGKVRRHAWQELLFNCLHFLGFKSLLMRQHWRNTLARLPVPFQNVASFAFTLVTPLGIDANLAAVVLIGFTLVQICNGIRKCSCWYFFGHMFVFKLIRWNLYVKYNTSSFCLRVRVHVKLSLCLHICFWQSLLLCLCLCLCLFVCVCFCSCVYVYVYVYVYVCVCVSVFVCLCLSLYLSWCVCFFIATRVLLDYIRKFYFHLWWLYQNFTFRK